MLALSAPSRALLYLLYWTADPAFNLLTDVYSFLIRQLLTSDLPKLPQTLENLTYNPQTGKPSLSRIKALVKEAAMISGKRKRGVVWDAVKTPEGRKVAVRALFHATSWPRSREYVPRGSAL
jgi:hypothetical protein